VDLAAGHDRDPFIEQIDHAAQDAALRLPAQAHRMKLCREGRR